MRLAFTVFFMSMATVIGPTPPGTGVMCEALGDTPAKWTSPLSEYPDFFEASATRLTPTSITTAPGFTMSAVTNSARPMAAIRTSAWRVIEAVEPVRRVRGQAQVGAGRLAAAYGPEMS